MFQVYVHGMMYLDSVPLRGVNVGAFFFIGLSKEVSYIYR